MKMFLKTLCIAGVMMVAYTAQVFAQPGGGMAMRMMSPEQARGNWQMYMNQRLTTDNGVQYTGSVLNEADQPMVGVSVIAYSPKTGYVYTAKSDKKGNFKMLLFPGTQYIVEFTAPGYKKFAAVCDAENKEIEGQPVKMVASVEGIAQMKGKAPIITGSFRNISITIGKHACNEERPLTDLLNELPAFEISENAFFAFTNPRTEIRINNQLLKVRPQALFSYLSNIEAKNLRVLRVSWADIDNKEAAQVYITVDE